MPRHVRDFRMKSILVASRRKSDPKMPSWDIGKSSFTTWRVITWSLNFMSVDPSVFMSPSVIPLRKIEC